MAEPQVRELLKRLQLEFESIYAENASLKANLRYSLKENNGLCVLPALPVEVTPPSGKGQQHLCECPISTYNNNDGFISYPSECMSQPSRALAAKALVKQPAMHSPLEGRDSELVLETTKDNTVAVSVLSGSGFVNEQELQGDQGNSDSTDAVSEPNGSGGLNEQELQDDESERLGLTFFRRSSVQEDPENVGKTLSELNAQPKSKLGALLESSGFELVVGALILTNTIIMAIEMQYKGIRAGYRMGFPSISRSQKDFWTDADPAFIIFERVFTIIFTVELLARLFALRCLMLKVPLNWLDILYVAISLLDWLASARTVVNPMMARMLRLAKLLRGLRLIKMAKMMSSLFLLLKSIAASVGTLSWSVLLLIVVQSIAGMTLSQLVSDFINDENQDLNKRHELFDYYGTFSRSMITMFEIHLANFAPACRVLLDTVGEEYAYIFLMYRCLAGFAVLNVINAVFIQQTMKVAQQDHDIMVEQRERAATQYSKELKALFKALDADGDRNISFRELKDAMDNQPKMKMWMSAMEITTHDVEGLFKIIDTNKDHCITPEEFFSAAVRIKGVAKSVDMVALTAQTKLIRDDLEKLLARVPNTLLAKNSEAHDCGI